MAFQQFRQSGDAAGDASGQFLKQVFVKVGVAQLVQQVGHGVGDQIGVQGGDGLVEIQLTSPVSMLDALRFQQLQGVAQRLIQQFAVAAQHQILTELGQAEIVGILMGVEMGCHLRLIEIIPDVEEIFVGVIAVRATARRLWRRDRCRRLQRGFGWGRQSSCRFGGSRVLG